jgi:preprotein translocase subunit SecE
VARDRKRAKQRRARRGPGRASTASPAPERSSLGQPLRADLPGALDHASSDVDEFDAALVRGAGGVAATPADVDDLEAEDLQTGLELDGDAGLDALQVGGVPPGGGGSSGGGGSGGGGDGPPGDGSLERPSGAPLRGGNRAVGFLRASWAELQRVQWPDRRQVFQATAVVLGFVAIAGAYLGLADYVAKEIVEFIL